MSNASMDFRCVFSVFRAYVLPGAVVARGMARSCGGFRPRPRRRVLGWAADGSLDPREGPGPALPPAAPGRSARGPTAAGPGACPICRKQGSGSGICLVLSHF